jgi:hypothetical protein
VVKIVPTSMFGEEKVMSRIGGIALGHMAAHVLETLEEIRETSETGDGIALFRSKLNELHSQFERIKRYLEING